MLTPDDVIEAVQRERAAWPKGAEQEKYAVERMAYYLAGMLLKKDRNFDIDGFLKTLGYPSQPGDF